MHTEDAADKSTTELRDAGYEASTGRIDKMHDVPFSFFGGRLFAVGAAIGLLIGNLLIATSITRPVMSAGLPAITTLFTLMFGATGGFTGWFAARPWQVRHVVVTTADEQDTVDVRRLMRRQRPSSVGEKTPFGRAA